jgi:hypothetical protein
MVEIMRDVYKGSQALIEASSRQFSKANLKLTNEHIDLMFEKQGG